MDRGLVQGVTSLHQYILNWDSAIKLVGVELIKWLHWLVTSMKSTEAISLICQDSSMKNALMLSTPCNRIEVAMLYCCIRHMWGISKHKEMELIIIGQMKLLWGWKLVRSHLNVWKFIWQSQSRNLSAHWCLKFCSRCNEPAQCNGLGAWCSDPGGTGRYIPVLAGYWL